MIDIAGDANLQMKIRLIDLSIIETTLNKYLLEKFKMFLNLHRNEYFHLLKTTQWKISYLQ